MQSGNPDLQTFTRSSSNISIYDTTYIDIQKAMFSRYFKYCVLGEGGGGLRDNLIGATPSLICPWI